MAEYSKTQLKGMNKDQLEELARELGVYPSSGSGADGGVLFNDLVDAIYDGQGGGASVSARDAVHRCVGCGAVNIISAVPGETFTFHCGSCGRAEVISVVLGDRG